MRGVPLQQDCVTCGASVKADVFEPGHLGELTRIIDTDLVDAVAEETGTVQKRVRLLPTRVVIFFVLALVLFESCGYRQVWAKLVAGLAGPVTRPSVSGLVLARRRVGPAPVRALFDAIAGPVAVPSMPGAFWRGLRMVALDATLLRLPDTGAVTAVYSKRRGAVVEWGYPLLRLSVLIECGTRAVLAAVFGPEKGPGSGEKPAATGLMGHLRPGMVLLLDAGYDSGALLAAAAATGAHYLCRSSSARTPLIGVRLPDGSYLSALPTGRGLIEVRIVEATITVRYADGTSRAQPWRLISSLLDHRRYPAADLVSLYHQRWEAETTFSSIKCTILDGRVLRSGTPADVEQEVWALLTAYQAIVHLTTDAARTAGLDPDRLSFTIALETARDQVIAATAIHPEGDPLIGPIGHAVLTHPLPPRRQRTKARTKKISTSKYPSAGTGHPRSTLTYTIDTQIMIFEKGLTKRSRP